MGESVNGAVEVEQQPAPHLPAEELHRRAEIAKRLAGAFGQIVSVMMRSEAHRLTHLVELEWLVMPALATGQFSIADAQSKSLGVVAPIAAVLWASVSAEVDERLSREPHKPIRLKPDEWKSGEIVWVIEALGESKALDMLFQSLQQQAWKGRVVKLRGLGQNGWPVVKTLP